MANKQGDKHGKAAKAGRNRRRNGQTMSETLYRLSGGNSRCAVKKAHRHGCGLNALHLRGHRDQPHAHKRQKEVKAQDGLAPLGLQP